MTHAGTPSAQEINGALISLNALAGIPLSAMKGFRAPYLQYDVSTLTQLKAAKFLYDSSATSVAPVTTTGEGAVWPYTLDHGLVNNCLDVPGICNGLPQIPGLWEIPMYATFDDVGSPHVRNFRWSITPFSDSWYRWWILGLIELLTLLVHSRIGWGGLLQLTVSN